MDKSRIRILLVDDHHMLRQTWRLLLESFPPLEVVADCGDGMEAIRLAAELKPDIVLMDINMEPINGFEATQRILEANPSQKIIAISIHNQPSYARRMLKTGARGYVTKNCKPQEMVLAIQEVMSGKEYICQEVADQM